MERLAGDGELLSELDAEVRERLLKASGSLARPGRLARAQYRKSRRTKRRNELKAEDEAVLNRTRIRNQRIALVYPTPEPQATRALADGESGASTAEPPIETVGRVRVTRSCYICKADFNDVHVFYDCLCPSCAVFNLGKRDQTADLSGKVALLTGGRVKIGFQVGIKLLRAGAELIVTTRFPRDAATRYAAEPDFDVWRERLSIHGLDLRHTPSVEALSQHLLKTAGRLDFVINNACQTVRRPPGFYAHLMEGEELPYGDLSSETRQVLASHEELRSVHQRLAEAASAQQNDVAAQGQPGGVAPGAEATPVDGVPAATEGPVVDKVSGLTLSAALSQVMLVKGDSDTGSHLFPEDTLDADLQQVDLRDRNSWRLALDEVPTVELLEVHLVNAVAPFVLAARLKPLMLATSNHDKHIVNVSAMEGQFYRVFKTDKHPHTNMAKASLNMLTRTSAPDYQRDGIHMNSVDTGWITDEDPAHITKQKQDEHGFFPPLDHVDAAARILDPIFVGMLTGEHLWGQFLKDYKPASW